MVVRSILQSLLHYKYKAGLQTKMKIVPGVQGKERVTGPGRMGENDG